MAAVQRDSGGGTVRAQRQAGDGESAAEERGVRSVEFNRATHTLRVAFESGATYDYADVPEHVYDELRHSADRDEYFHANIRDDFASTRVGDVDLAEVRHELREDALLGDDDDAGDTRELEAPAARQRGHRSRHVWIVDVIDEDSAAVEVDGRQITPIPRWLLPADARDGDVLRVTHERAGTRSALVIEVDRASTRAAFDRSRQQLADAGTGDQGGDITLS